MQYNIKTYAEMCAGHGEREPEKDYGNIYFSILLEQSSAPGSHGLHTQWQYISRGFWRSSCVN